MSQGSFIKLNKALIYRVFILVCTGTKKGGLFGAQNGCFNSEKKKKIAVEEKLYFVCHSSGSQPNLRSKLFSEK